MTSGIGAIGSIRRLMKSFHRRACYRNSEVWYETAST